MYGHDFNKALESYYNLTGYPCLIPRYALGTWWNKNEIYNEENIKDIKESFKRSEIPLSVVLLNKWNKENTDFIVNETQFPNFKILNEELKKDNVHTGLKINTTSGIRPTEPTYPIMKQDMVIKENENVPINVYSDIVINRFLKNVLNPLENLRTDFYLIDDESKDPVKEYLLDYYLFTDSEKIDKKRISFKCSMSRWMRIF